MNFIFPNYVIHVGNVHGAQEIIDKLGMPQKVTGDKSGFEDFIKNMEKESFHITSLHKNDIIETFHGHNDIDKITEVVKSLKDTDMEWLASKLSDAFCNCCYWDNLQEFFKDHFLNKEED